MKIKSKVPERELIEYCCNLYHAGYDYAFLLALHSMANSWKLDKFTYYVRLIEEIEE